MDLKYTEVSKQIGLAASHIEFDSQGDSILIDCYHLSCLEKCHKSKLLFSHILHHLLVHLLIDIVNCCSWDFMRGVWIQNVAVTWIRVCDINLCSWHWLRGIVILNPGHQTWNSFSSQLWQWIQNTLPATRVVWTLCEARRVAPPVQTTASCFPYSLIGFYDYPI